MIWILLSAFVLWTAVFIFIDKKIQLEKDESNVIQDQKEQFSLSVIIVMRNEAENILRCLSSIDAQVNLPDSVKVILIDDHSEDESANIAASFKSNNFDLIQYGLDVKSGKKHGLRLALSHVHSGFIYFTDADCQLLPNVMSQLYARLRSGKFWAVFGPVQLKSKSFWEQILSTENLNNQCVTEAFVKYRNPIMANGANMMISAEAINTYRDSLESKTESGDDVFFAQKLGEQATCAMVSNASVWTKPPADFSEFCNQRIRWAAKSIKYPSKIAKTFGGLVFIINLVFAISLFAIPFVNGVFWIVFLFGLKTLIEFAYHKRWLYKYGIRHRLYVGFILSGLYPFYVVLIGLFSTLGIGYKWKGRVAKR
jgi:glycosyltransferase involved in cell wall biosynthesis